MLSLKIIPTAILIFVLALALPAVADTIVPQLPAKGQTLEDFAPPGWSILDYVDWTLTGTG